MGRTDSGDAAGRSPGTARFEAVYERHIRAVTAYCTRRLPHDQVADAVAETFLVVWRRIDDVPHGDVELLWLYRVAHRVVGHAWRSAGRRRRLHDRLASRRVIVGASPDEVAVNRDEVRRVLSAASRLRSADAEVLRLSSWEQLDAAEISAVLEISPNAVHQRLHRARQHLVREYDNTQQHVSNDTSTQGGNR